MVRILVRPDSFVGVSTRDSSGALKAAHSSGWLLVGVGAVSIVAGILALVYPEITLLVLALIAGINVFLFGLLGIVNAVIAGGSNVGARVLVAILGVLGLLAGLVMMRRPGETLLVILLAVGLWLIISGVVEGAIALGEPADRGVRLLGALFDLVLGILLLALPELSLGTVAVFCGLSFVLRGAFTVYVGLKVRRKESS